MSLNSVLFAPNQLGTNQLHHPSDVSGISKCKFVRPRRAICLVSCRRKIVFFCQRNFKTFSFLYSKKFKDVENMIIFFFFYFILEFCSNYQARCSQGGSTNTVIIHSHLESDLKFWVWCQVSSVICHMSRVRCHISRARCH